MNINPIVMLIVICNRKIRQNIIDALSEERAVLFNVVYGHGSAKHENALKVFGLSHEYEKAVIFSFITKENSGKALKMLEEKFAFDKPNTGFAFTVPIEEKSN